MYKVLGYIKRTVAIVVIFCLIILTSLSIITSVNIDISFCFNLSICLIFSIILLKNSYGNGDQVRENNNKKKSWIIFLIFAGVFLSVVELYMFYEEMVRERSGISCAIAAIASYTLFDSVHKYLRKE